MIDPVMPKVSSAALSNIVEVSGGNPPYALELARALPHDLEMGQAVDLPTSLQGRWSSVWGPSPPLSPPPRDDLRHRPATIVQSQRFLPDTDVESLLLEANELDRLVVEEIERVRFAHPLLTAAIYGTWTLSRRSLHLSWRSRAIPESATGTWPCPPTHPMVR